MSKSVVKIELPSQKMLVKHWSEMSAPAKEAAWLVLNAIYSLQGELTSRKDFMEKLFSENAELAAQWKDYIESIAIEITPRRIWMDSIGYFDRAKANAA